MPRLTITTTASTGNEALGPLSVEVLGAGGRPVSPPLTMSSLRTEVVVNDVEPGEYTVVATRPSGEQLIAPATVDEQGGRASITMAGRSPHEYLTEASRLGLISSPSFTKDIDLRQTALESLHIRGNATRSLATLLREAVPAATRRLSLVDSAYLSESYGRSADYVLGCWQFVSDRWQPHEVKYKEISEDYLQIRVDTTMPLALGLMNEKGFGPIVIVPDFFGGTDVTFLSAGVAMEENADRAGIPSAVRVPVALAVPLNAGLADLLVGLSAPVLPNAEQVLEQGRGHDPASALEFLSNKFVDAAAAILGALFIARFSPEKLPVEWIRNLTRLRPHCSDTWVLLTLAMSNSAEAEKSQDAMVVDALRKASISRCTLFGRTRLLLSKMALQYGPFPRARQDEVKFPRRARTGDYLDFAADAGGLEAFWGCSPTRPGFPAAKASLPREGQAIKMRGGKFIHTAKL